MAQTRQSVIPIAVVGIACRFPGGANDPEKLWSLLAEGRSAWSEVPPDRFNWEAFYHPSTEAIGIGALNHRGGHFLDQDVRAFDPSFFGISPLEAHTMDPQQRIQLETAYEALENAGLPIESVRGSQTAVYISVFSRDYDRMQHKDPSNFAQYSMLGIGDAIIANRISYVFDFKGASLTLDTGCSGSLVALHQACQDLRLGESSMALVGGTNLILAPDTMIPMNLVHILSPDGKCYPFDSRGSGYGRGEGVATIVLKRLDDAVKAGDSIRAIIRHTGVNQDGRTSGITFPSQEAQQNLIQSVYQSVSLDPRDTGYIEAHGTGTVAGDIAETKAIMNGFQTMKKRDSPLYVGSIKANIGHLESSSGIAGLIKAILVLEKGWIPPNINLENFKEELGYEEATIKVPTHMTRWPGDKNKIRRASVNSFGYGGTNAHAILEQAPATFGAIPRNTDQPVDSIKTSKLERMENEIPQLLVFTAHSRESLAIMVQNAASWASSRNRDSDCLRNLAYTLCLRRSIMKWSCTLIASTMEELASRAKSQSRVTKAHKYVHVTFVFTGQGSQWFAMGRELMHTHSQFKESLQRADKILQDLGAEWSLIEELLLEKTNSRINQSKISQPTTTALQIALVDLLKSLGVEPGAVLGHSSGEIGASYSAGILTQTEALKVAYYRSFVSLHDKIIKSKGAMLAVGLSAAEVEVYISQLQRGSVSVACINSPSSVTVSGDETGIDELKENLDKMSFFNRKLLVDTAYHSHHMLRVADEYHRSLEGLSWQDPKGITFISSVIASKKTSNFGPSYWVENLVSKVRFSDALEELYDLQHKIAQAATPEAISDTLHVLLEIGPHNALSGPIHQTIAQLKLDSFKYSYIPTLVRGQDATRTILELSGLMSEYGYPVNLKVANSLDGATSQLEVLQSLPPYPWDHSATYWHESRLSKEYRLRAHPHHDLLGLRILSNNTNEPVWRNTISVDNLPWLRDHVVDSLMVFPGTAYLCMAIEAIQQISHDRGIVTLRQFLLKNVVFQKALVIPESPSKVEIQISLRPPKLVLEKNHNAWNLFQVSCLGQDEKWYCHCYGLIRIEPDQSTDNSEFEREENFETIQKRDLLQRMKILCCEKVDPKALYHELRSHGNSYGSTFQIIKQLQIGNSQAVATVGIPDVRACMPSAFMQPHTIHPITFDSLLHINIPLFNLKCGPGTVMPVSIDEITISADLAHMPSSEIIIATELISIGARSGLFDIVGFQEVGEADLKPMINITACEIHRTGGSQEQPPDIGDDRKMSFYRLEWEPDVDFLTGSDIRLLTPDLEGERGSVLAEQTNNALNAAAVYYISQCLESVTGREHEILDKYEYLLKWMKCYTCSEEGRDLLCRSQDLETTSMLQDVHQVSAAGEMVSRVGKNLDALLTGKLEPLSLLLGDGLLHKVYTEDSSLRCSSYLATYIKNLLFKKPFITVLEIGAGTGGTTLPLFQALDAHDNVDFQRYDFTDISTGFFEPAKSLLRKWSGFLKFKKLDIERDPMDQGFEESSYDLIIAGNVLHATSPIRQTLAYVRRLLKPGGRLALVEVTKLPPFVNMTFGLLPGWWKGVDDGRKESPLLSTEQWNDALKHAAFSGVDMAINDYENSAQKCTMMVAHLLQQEETPCLASIEICCFKHDDLAQKLHSVFRKRRLDSCCVTLPSIQVNKNKIYVLLDSGDQPILVDPSKEEFRQITSLLTQGKQILWVTVGHNEQTTKDPERGLIMGLARVARSENQALELVTLNFQQSINQNYEELPNVIFDVVSKSFNASTSPQDLEYIWRNKHLEVLRLIPDIKVKNFMIDNADESRIETQAYQQSDRPLKLHVAKPGMLDSLIFVDDESARRPIASNEVEIRVKAYGINFKDVFVALGQLKESTRMAGECSGVVTAVGCESSFHIGDRVCAWNGTPYASYSRVKNTSVHLIPSTMSFETAASIPVAFLTAYYSLVEVARLSKNQKVLIHAASGGVGQAAIMIAQDIGAEIFATVGSDAKRQILVERYAIPSTHIFSSRSGTFKKGLLRLTHNYGMDVILNSLSGEALHDTWVCVARFGTFVEIGKTDIHKKGQLDMAPFDRNVNFCSVDMVSIAEYRPEVMIRLFAKIISMFDEGRLTPVYPITTMSIGEIEDAFRLIQARKHVGKVVLQVGDRSTVKSVAATSASLQLVEEATYVIAGGQGDLGKKIINFMVDHRAKYFAILSRRGLNPEIAEFLDTISAKNAVKVQVISCDITDVQNVKRAINLIKQTMPPIKGVIQGAMVLQDRVLEEMTVDDYKAALNPKVLGTRNLVDALADHTFDFFIMLSSCCSILGNSGQANYAAGNSYQDALVSDETKTFNARYISLNLGLIEDSEVLLDHPERKLAMTRSGYIPISIRVLFKLLDYSMGANYRGDNCKQLATGFDKRIIFEQRPSLLKNAMFNHLPYAVDILETKQETQGIVNIAATIAAAFDIEGIHAIISSAISRKISSLVGFDEDINLEYAMENLGLDSLIVIELKNWIFHTMHASVETPEILDSRNIKALTTLVATRSTFVPIKLKVIPVSNSRESTVSEMRKLPSFPLPELADSLGQYLESVRSFCSPDDMQRLASAIVHFQGPKGLGRELHQRLVARTKDPYLDDWLSDLYTLDTWVRRRVPLNPWGHFFGCFPDRGKSQSQVRRAAIISLAALRFRQYMEAGGLKQEYSIEQPLSMDLHQWIFDSYLEPGIGVDKIRKTSTSNYIIALRNGHIFQIVIDASQSYRSLEAIFEELTNKSHTVLASIATLTADERDSWAKVRGELKAIDPANSVLLGMIEGAAFIVCLDDSSPSDSTARVNQFLLGGVSNRWSDKSLQLVICKNGVWAAVAEHAMLDGDTLNQLTRAITDAIAEDTEAEVDHESTPVDSKMDKTLTEQFFILTPSIQGRINHVEQLFRNTVAPCEYTHHTYSQLGASFFRNYKCAPKPAFQITIQLASFLYFGTQFPCLEAVSMRHFHKGRLDFIQTTILEVAEFCASAFNEETLASSRRQLFFEAVKALTNLSTRTTRGRGFRNHLLGLRMVLKEHEELPALFDDPSFGLIAPGKISTDCLEWNGMVQEAGFHRPGEGKIWVHYEVHNNHCQLSIKGEPGRTHIFFAVLERAAGMVKKLLESD